MARQGTSRGRLALTLIERNRLEPVAQMLDELQEEMLERGYAAYASYGAPQARLSPDEFCAVARCLAHAMQGMLGSADPGGLEQQIRSLGAGQAEQDVPFSELVSLVHTLMEVILMRVKTRAGDVVRGLAKLVHCQLVLLAEGYGDAPSARLGTGAPPAVPTARAPDDQTQQRQSFYGLVGNSAPMKQVYRQVEAAATGRGPVFIVGETGTGKELAARALHRLGSASPAPLVVVNCASLPRELVEGELFGHRKGAYTGAEQAHDGLVRAAAGGILFLDEITEMAREIQAKLLRVLEQGAVRAVGTVEELPVDVRFVASTNRDPQRAIRSGALREDIYHRLNVHRIELPPLREHLEDIPALVEHFIEQLTSEELGQAARLDDEALALLRGYPWPGNVRELRNAVEAAMTSATGPVLRCAELPHFLRKLRTDYPPTGTEEEIPTIEQAEHQLIERALLATGGNKRRAAELLGISRHRLYDRLRSIELGSRGRGPKR